jgi:hypothetical protein
MYPWSWNYGGTANATDVNIRGGLFDAGVCVDVAGKGAFAAVPAGQEQGPAVFNVYAGTVITPVALTWGGEGDINGLWVGGSQSMVSVYTNGIANIYGGSVSVPRIAIYNGQINLRGGILEGLTPPHTDAVGADHNDFWIGDLMLTNRLNIAGGTLRLNGDWTNVISEYNSVGKIIAYDGRGSPTWDYDVISPGWTTVTGIDLGIAGNPYPADGQWDVNITPTLTWTPGDYVQQTNEHRVYFGTNYNEVLNATTGYVVRDVNNYAPPWPIEFYTTYYWRVDEVNDANGDSPWKGKVWHFTTQPPPPCEPIYPPYNSDTGLDINRLYLSWKRGWLAAENDGNGYDVYFGTSWAEVNSAVNTTPVIYRGRQITRQYYLSNLEPDYTLVADTKYYWRIDEINNTNPLKMWHCGVWRFTFRNFFVVDDFSS